MDKTKMILRFMEVTFGISVLAMLITSLVAYFVLGWHTPFEIGNALFYGALITAGIIYFFMPKHGVGPTIAEAKVRLLNSQLEYLLLLFAVGVIMLASAYLLQRIFPAV